MDFCETSDARMMLVLRGQWQMLDLLSNAPKLHLVHVDRIARLWVRSRTSARNINAFTCVMLVGYGIGKRNTQLFYFYADIVNCCIFVGGEISANGLFWS